MLRNEKALEDPHFSKAFYIVRWTDNKQCFAPRPIGFILRPGSVPFPFLECFAKASHWHFFVFLYTAFTTLGRIA